MTPHLHPSVAKLLTLPDRQRQQSLFTYKWIPYTRAQHVIRKLDDLRTYPPTHRMPNMLLVGDTNSGKTVILRHYTETHPSYAHEEDGRLVRPVVFMQAPPGPDEGRFYNILLDQVYAPYRTNDRVDKKQRQVIHTLRHLGVRMLIIDEIQHVLAGSQAKQRLFLNVLKYLSNELMIPLVCAGIRTAFNAIQHDEQLANRFEPVALQSWSMGDEYRRLLLSFELLLPLHKPSNLMEDTLAYKLLDMSEGRLGELARILRLAAVQAIDEKTECITPAGLSRLDYTVPSERMIYHRLFSVEQGAETDYPPGNDHLLPDGLLSGKGRLVS